MDSPMPDLAASSNDHESSLSEDSMFSNSNHIPEIPVNHLSDMDNRVKSRPRPVEEQMVIHARAYQVEMLEESLKQNIIVAMDTGSGKTQVAVLRIQAELDKCSDKIIWFLAPTIPLCEQQFRVLKSQLGAAQVKLLSGADNVDTWSDNQVWDAYLENVRVMVSTYQILLDAVTHAFVQFSRLSLIVFDEAHNCVGKSPGSKIMERYHINKSNGKPCPAILGLTASPIMRSRLDDIEKIEHTLDAVCRTPTIHREDFISAVKRPVLEYLTIPRSADSPPTESMTTLAQAFRSIDIYKDPYIMDLRGQKTEQSMMKLKRALEKRDTYVIKQMQSCCRRSSVLLRELGPWAADAFIYHSVTQFLESSEQDNSSFGAWEQPEKQFLADALRMVKIKLPLPLEEATSLDVSARFTTLVQELQSTPAGTRCIIFVREISTVALLADMLSKMTSIRSLFRVGTVIGTSNFAGRKRDLGDIDQVKDSRDLEDFRTGHINLLIATSVAEEGLDIPACNLIICFNPPANVKSFIQRRGRARMENSRFILLSEESTNQLQTWVELECEMKKHYEDAMRTAQELSKDEVQETNSHVAPLTVPSTGARIDVDQAKSHLEYFCQKLTKGQSIDHRPYYITQEIQNSAHNSPLYTAVVVLTPSLPPALRRVKSLGQWKSENNAFKDAALQALKAIHETGLLNDNLMPLIDDILEGIETRSSLMTVDDLWKPWPKVARLWKESSELLQREILLKDDHRVIARFDASLPCPFPKLLPFKIFWDAQTTWTVETSENIINIPASILGEDQSAALIDLAYGHRWKVDNSPHVLHLQCTEDIAYRQHVGRRTIKNSGIDPEFVIRSSELVPHIFTEWLPSRPPWELVKHPDRNAYDEPVDVPWLAVRIWPRRGDHLHPVKEEPPKPDGRYSRILPVSQCTVDTIDQSKAYFGTILPSIMHMLEIYLTANELCQTLLKEVGFSNLSLVVTAISASAAVQGTDYERLEFLGDSILKLLATSYVMVQHPNYPEGYLSALKDRIVANSRLCRAADEKGLAKFILTKSFTGLKWRPLYIKDLLSAKKPPSTKRQLSSKTLADVVESLVGAAYEDGGMPKALACLGVFLPKVNWYDLQETHTILFNRKGLITQLPPVYEPLEELIGYTFRNKAFLMESITHASWPLSTTKDASMERLEFFGDSVLDSIIVSVLFPLEPELTNNQMHLLRTATVNADLLGFLVMEWSITQDFTEISTDLTPIIRQERIPFYKFMRHNSPQVLLQQKVSEERHAVEREAILDALANSPDVPWTELGYLATPKFFSDMFESLIGAVWVDSGSMETCKGIVERIGILPYLRRMLADHVNPQHPKNKFGELMGRQRKVIKYKVDKRVEEDKKKFFCDVLVNEKLVVRVEGVNQTHVVTKAADEAYRLFLRRAEGLDDDEMDCTV